MKPQLVYAVLHVAEISTLQLYKEKVTFPISEVDSSSKNKIKYNFVLRRKECLVRESPPDLGINI